MSSTNGQESLTDNDRDDKTASDVMRNGTEPELKLPNQPWNLFTMFFHEVGRLLCARITLSELNSDPANMKSRHAVLSSVVANGLPPEDIPGIYTALVYLAMLLYPDSSPALVDACLIATADSLTRLGIAQ
ncbi:hypothetical protein FGIG_12687 [Fasciola gigantica]|uniref:Uncharacterized protein n=1 Tax=Fasciola gigantica TaxID=46835 RepID=A0A504YMV2_FASGI|nr:hypothetical protein FGIG_12687 [Fasciola gigantica]